MYSTSFELLLEQYLNETITDDYTSAVGIVQYRDKWLLGLSTAKDDRSHKWCFPGGRLKNNECPLKGAEREVKEETGIICYAKGEPFKVRDKKGVAFCHCKVKSINQKLKPNSEFIALGWFKVSDMKGLKLHANVKYLIERVS